LAKIGAELLDGEEEEVSLGLELGEREGLAPKERELVPLLDALLVRESEGLLEADAEGVWLSDSLKMISCRARLEPPTLLPRLRPE